VFVLAAIVLEPLTAAELPGADGRRKAFTLCAKCFTASGTEAAIFQNRALNVLPERARWKKTAAERAINLTIQLKLP
jgi:hypothetical protein